MTKARPTRTRSLADLPQMARPVGLHGSFAQAEVGGALCFGVAVTVTHTLF